MLRKYGVSAQRRNDNMGNIVSGSAPIRALSAPYSETQPGHYTTEKPPLQQYSPEQPPPLHQQPHPTAQGGDTREAEAWYNCYRAHSRSGETVATGPRAPLAQCEFERPARKLLHSQSFQHRSNPHHTSSKMADSTQKVTTSDVPSPTEQDNALNDRLQCQYSQSFSELAAPLQGAEQEELQSLRREAFVLRQELQQCRATIARLSQRDTQLDRLTSHAQRQMSASSRFEDLTLGDARPTQLIRRYGNLYSQARLDAIDALDDLPEISDLDDLKGKLLFSIVVLAFRSVQATLRTLKSQLRQLLCMPGEAAEEEGSGGGAGAGGRDVVEAALAYLRRTVDQYDLSTNITEVSSQLYLTLYDYPGLKSCRGLQAYIEDCVRVSWGLSVQTPAYVIKYDAQGAAFDAALFSRFHASDGEGERMLSVLWPALLEGEAGPCVHKGVVAT